MAKKFLDETGLTKVWAKIKSLFATKSESNQVQTNLTNFMNTKSKANGLCPLDENTKVPSAYLPSYVDDVIEGYYKVLDQLFYKEETYTNKITGESGKIYIDLSTGNTYRWGGTVFAEISKSITIGGQAGQAFDGALGAQLTADVNRLETGMTSLENIVNGKAEQTTVTNHINNKSNPHGVTASQVGLGNVDNTSDANKPISTATQTALNNKLDKLVDGKYSFTELAKGISLEAFENFVGTFIEDAQDHLYIANSNVYYSFGNSASDKLKFNSEDNQYEVLDESMALTATEIEAICV